MQRLERLINLMAALLAAERPLPADELKERVPGYPDAQDTFRRAFERDKEALRELGVPLSMEPVGIHRPGVDGYRIHKDEYYLKDPGLAGDELAALHLAASTVHLEGADGVEALWKLGGELAEGGPAPPVASLPGADHLGALFAAVSARQRVAFRYRTRHRLVEPHRLSFRNGHWYLSAHDTETGEQRSFRLDRIESGVEASGELNAFTPTTTTDGVPAPWELGAEEPLTARLLVDASQSAWAVGHLGPEAVEKWRSDRSVVLSVRVTNRPAFRSFVLGFLEHAEILGPPELRDDMVSWLEALAADPAPSGEQPGAFP